MHEEATSLIEVGNMYKKSEPSVAMECYHQAVEIYIEMGHTIPLCADNTLYIVQCGLCKS